MAINETIFVTGASGFVGRAIVHELLNQGYSVRASVRQRPTGTKDERVKTVQADLFNASALEEQMLGCRAVIHLVGIIYENRARGQTFERIHYQATRSVVDATKRAGVKRFIHMSALGTRPGAVSEYHRTKYKAEEYVRASGLDWTIFRPSVIHGRGGEFMEMEAKWVRGTGAPFLFMPYFGAGPLGAGGAGMLQPILVNDVARAFADSIHLPATIGQVYPLGGAQRVSWPELHRISAVAISGGSRMVLPMPAWVAGTMTRVVPGKLLPFNRDQVIMSQEDNTCDMSKFRRDFGWEPKGFEETLKSYARDM